MIGYVFCGSFCTLTQSLEQMTLLSHNYEIIPIFSTNVYTTDTRFWRAEDFRAQVEKICERKVIHTIVDAEPLGPQIRLDAMIVAPCTGNTLAKIANGITDTPACMAIKAHLRGNRPLVIALASNDALSANLKNIAILLEKKCVFFVPMTQDNPHEKPHSLVADFTLIEKTLESALRGVQYQRVFI
ncbi:MAG: dipicolinate synthase subunit B [Clostridiales bacterium]|nr:dipicolinate synthase subunit B [Clostridiales bacterium]